MDNQNPTNNQTSTPENVPAQNPAVAETPPQVYTAPHIDNPPPKKPFLTGKIILIVIILSVILSAGGTYLALNSKPNPQPVVSKVIPTPTPTPTPVDETANWKTYTDIGYSIKHPASWIIEEAEVEKNSRCALLGQEIAKAMTICFSTEKFSDVWPEYINNPDKMKIVINGYWAYKNAINPGAFFVLNSKEQWVSISPAGLSDKKLFNKILSTFTFLNIFPTPTCRPRPACLDATPRCLIPETSDMCRPSATPSPGGGDIVCTQDAKLCPDGKTYVGRRGPNCEFAVCPGQ